MKKTILFCTFLALLLTLAGVSQTPAGPKHHVVFQLSEPESDEWVSFSRT